MDDIKYTVTAKNNFCRVLAMPDEEDYPEDFLFAGSKEVTFELIDWFNPLSEPAILTYDDTV